MIWKYDGAIEIENLERDTDASIAADPVGREWPFPDPPPIPNLPWF